MSCSGDFYNCRKLNWMVSHKEQVCFNISILLGAECHQIPLKSALKKFSEAILSYHMLSLKKFYASSTVNTFHLIPMLNKSVCTKSDISSTNEISCRLLGTKSFGGSHTWAGSCTGAGLAGNSPVPPAAAAAFGPPLTRSACHSVSRSWCLATKQNESVLNKAEKHPQKSYHLSCYCTNTAILVLTCSSSSSCTIIRVNSDP